MNPQSTSFIPQRPVQGATKKRNVRKIYVFTYISYVLFFGSAMAAVGTFFYDSLLDTRLQAQKDRLIAEEAKFDQQAINSVRALDQKIKSAQKRMDLHLSVPLIFAALERNVTKSLVLKSFTYERENDTAPKMEITGEAQVFNSLAFQREILASEPILAGGDFTQVTLASEAPTDEETGVVKADQVETKIAFWLGKQIDTSLLRYQPEQFDVVSELSPGASDDIVDFEEDTTNTVPSEFTNETN
jgi:hypothetical protein